MEKHDRLRAARIRAGFESAADAARRLGVSYGTYSSHENGLRGIKEADLVQYARAYGVTVEWLRTGREHFVQDRVPVHCIGDLGTLPGGELHVYDDTHNDKILLLPTTIDVPAAYLYVKGDMVRPLAVKGSIVVCSANFYSKDDGPSDGDLCICELPDGSKWLRYVYKSQKEGCYDLESLFSDPQRGQQLTGISPVHFISTRYAYRRMVARNQRDADTLGDKT